MKIAKLLKTKGIEKILDECNYDLADVRLFLIRECRLKKGYDLSKYIKIFKNTLIERTKDYKSLLIDEFDKKLKG